MPRRRTPAHHDSDMYAIFRKSPADSDGQQAWIVNLTRGGRPIQSTFSFSVYGGEAAALFVARAYRDAVLEVVPPLTLRDMRMLKRKDNRGQRGDHPRSQITGVHHTAATKGRAAFWTARIEITDPTKPSGRRSIVRTFSTAKYGDDGARIMAEEERMRLVMAVENGEDPALRSSAAKRLNKRLARNADTGENRNDM